MYNQDEVKEFLRTRVARPASAGMVVYNHQNEALVVKANYKPYWSFPGGWIEEGQTPLQAAIRELEEEVGIKIERESTKFLFTMNRISDVMQSYQFMFECNQPIDSATPITLQPEEIDAYAFVSREEVLADPAKFGGAVKIWASGSQSGYFEQIVQA